MEELDIQYILSEPGERTTGIVQPPNTHSPVAAMKLSMHPHVPAQGLTSFPFTKAGNNAAAHCPGFPKHVCALYDARHPFLRLPPKELPLRLRSFSKRGIHAPRGPPAAGFHGNRKAAAMRGRRLSSISLEILFFLNGWYSATYFLTELFMFLYKSLLLPYPKTNLVLDLAMFFLYFGTEFFRIHFGRKGNLCQRITPLGISLALTFPSALMAFYYFLFQTYVLRIEAVMTMLLLPFYSVQVILEVLTLTTLSNKDSL
ncbi:transmembrane protein 216-like [Gracilinanus agilis]|uniref:transmembrane protein 216-like n=1 Tax=Gracilinanus agilis TaxID=191870 RepID=UPI001CFDC52B|nr:transmembrane protein 216-like [Gracilinanus agilis]